MDNIYDLVIVGGGPAGLTAGIYASRARMKVILVEKALCGGQILTTDTIENYPGFPDGIKGPDLAEWMSKQAQHFGLEVRTGELEEIGLKGNDRDPFSIRLDGGQTLKSLSIIIATGAKWNKLGIPGEDEFAGKGVSYCGTCDGPLFRNKTVAVIGGGDTALEDALFLTKFAAKVMIIHRRDRFRGTKILQERVKGNPKIELRMDSVASQIVGERTVKGIRINNIKTSVESTLNCDGVFIFIGLTPNSEAVKDILNTDDKGYIISDDDMRTSVDGIFACGDVRRKSLRQVVTAAGEGATAEFSAEHYVDCLKGTGY